MTAPARTRLRAGCAAVLTLAAGLALTLTAEGAVGSYAGDALYTVLVYLLVVLIAPRVRPLTAAAVALVFSWAVELFQLSGVPAELSAQSFGARLVLGSTFNAPDLLWYAVGAASVWLVHARARARAGTRTTVRGPAPAPPTAPPGPGPLPPRVPGPRGGSAGRGPGPSGTRPSEAEQSG